MKNTNRFCALSVVLLSLSGAANANAATQSEYFFQPGSSETNFSPFINYLARTTRYGSLATRSKGISTGFGLSHGLTENLSLGTSLSYSGRDVAYASGRSSEQSGLNDLNLAFLARIPSQIGVLHASIVPQFSPEPSFYDIETKTLNSFSGGHSLALGAGWDNSIGGGLLTGVNVDYRHFFDSKLRESDGDSQISTGGNAVSLATFLELPQKSWTPGLSLSVTHYAEGESVESDRYGKYSYLFGNVSYFSPGLYTSVNLSRNWDLLMAAGYTARVGKTENSGNDTGSGAAHGSLGFRSTF